MALEPPFSSDSGDIGKDDIFDLLKDDSAKPEEKDVKGEKDEKEAQATEVSQGDDDEEEEGTKEREEGDEGEDETAIGDEDDEKVLQLDDKSFPRKQEILKEFPNLFKRFPGLEASIYRDRQFSEVFPTPEDAREASEKAQQLEAFGNDIGNGDILPLFQTVKANDPDAFLKLADNVMEAIGQVDERAYHNIIGNIVKYTIIAMADEAKTNKDEELMEHAAALNRFVFRTEKFVPPRRLAPSDNTPERQEVQNERMELAREKFEEAQSGLQGRVDNTIKSTISTYIDPNKEMEPFVKKHAMSEAFNKLETVLAEDRVLRSTLNRLWRQANAEGYSSSSLDKIRAAYLSKAKTYLRDVIRSSRNEALGKRSRKNVSNGDNRDRRGHIPVGRSAGLSTGKKGLEIPKGMSNKDWIMSD